jgi:lipopolysaccharide/colanic/teichoic acid biosynthesis glycosyltransferase
MAMISLNEPRVAQTLTEIVVTPVRPANRRRRRVTPGDVARRVLNILVAAIALVLTAPLMLVVAILVKISSPGPVFYTQKRVGFNRRRRPVLEAHGRRRADMGGRLFEIYKFRTMCVQESSAAQVWASSNDSRVTPIGRVLRKYRLDELPQLVNVLKGDMNIVGPRPEQPRIFSNLREEIENYAHRQRVLPGITGWAQINHHYDSCIEDVKRKVSFDLEYIQRRSTVEDLRIMMRTIPVMLFQKGAW